jgi:hypothetical protein
MIADTSRTESAARDAANLAGRVEDFGGGVGHEFSLRGVPGSRLLIVVCSCGVESEPVHLSNTEMARQRHLAEVATDV